MGSPKPFRSRVLILGIHPGYHNNDAVVFDDYRMLAAVQLERPINPLYADIFAGFKQASGLLVLLDTSFNVQEEPIPYECAHALADGRIAYVVTERGVYDRSCHSDG